MIGMGATLRTFVDEGGGMDDLRAECLMGGTGEGDYSHEPSFKDWDVPYLRADEGPDGDPDHTARLYAAAKRVRPFRCPACGFRWPTEDKRDRCCGGMRWGLKATPGCLANSVPDDVCERIRLWMERGYGPKAIAELADVPDNLKGKNSAFISRYTRFKREIMAREGLEDAREWRLWQKATRLEWEARD